MKSEIAFATMGLVAIISTLYVSAYRATLAMISRGHRYTARRDDIMAARAARRSEDAAWSDTLDQATRPRAVAA